MKSVLSLVKIEGKYEVVEGSKSFHSTLIDLGDISLGGVSLRSSVIKEHVQYHDEFKIGAFFDLVMPKIGTLDTTTLRCEVMRSCYEGPS